MAVTSRIIDSTLVMEYEVVLEGQETPVKRQRSIKNIRANAPEEDVYDVAVALFSLLDQPLIGVRLDVQNELTSEG